MNDLFEERNALMCSVRDHRFALWRIWDKDLPMVSFIGLNPSTANEIKDDPTIRRVRRFAMDWGFGGFYMLNLFTKVTPNPDDLLKEGNLQTTSDYWMGYFTNRSSEIVFAWGNFKIAQDRAKQIATHFPDAMCLEKNKNGSPKHPLYVRADIQRTKFNSK